METFSICVSYKRGGIEYIQYPLVEAESEEDALNKLKSKFEEQEIFDAAYWPPVNIKNLKA